MEKLPSDEHKKDANKAIIATAEESPFFARWKSIQANSDTREIDEVIPTNPVSEKISKTQLCGCEGTYS